MLDMQEYQVTKPIKATPMTFGEYKDYRGDHTWSFPKDEEEGFLVEYPGFNNANDERHKGLIAWLAKEDFNNTYYKAELGSSFSMALSHVKEGAMAVRVGWPEGQHYIILIPGCRPLQQPDNYEDALYMFGKNCKFTPWTPTQEDLMANDWKIVR